MISSGYYDVFFEELVCTVLEDGSWSSPVAKLVVWRGARVLMVDINGDVIVEHHPTGWGSGVMRCIERIQARFVGAAYRFVPIPIPEAL